jgi:hypothetical protein
VLVLVKPTISNANPTESASLQPGVVILTMIVLTVVMKLDAVCLIDSIEIFNYIYIMFYFRIFQLLQQPIQVQQRPVH